MKLDQTYRAVLGAIAVVSAVATLAACSTNAGQQTNASTNPAAKQSITDLQIHKDLLRYEYQQNEIKKLNDAGKFPVASYSMAKAQCWLDVSVHENTRNDRSNFPADSFSESQKITEFLSKGGSATAPANPANQTPLVNDAAKLRGDLWDAAQKLKGHEGFACAAQKVACAEVELVHAGNEFNQQQWRHAKPYVQIAEDLISDAQKSAQACLPPPKPIVPAVVEVPKPVPVPGVVKEIAPVTAPVIVPVSLTANALFNFDKRDLTNVRPYSKDQIDTMLTQLKAGVEIQSIRLVGHADRLNSTGNINYNQKLSEDRVETIKTYLLNAGVAASLIRTEYKAESEPIEACTKAKFRSTTELQECLLPNRRVEIVATGTKRAN
jgi:OmpA-OmpF porin, OOP family